MRVARRVPQNSKTTEAGLPTLDLYWMNIETGKRTRITFAPGPDVLPVFSPDYTKVMWTRSPDGRSASQLYIADFTPPKE
jgi:TolB protein